MTSNFFLFVAMIALVTGSAFGNAGSITNTDCEKLVGTWEGSHTDKETGVHTDYEATHDGDGSFAAKITIYEPGKPVQIENQKGRWRCRGNVFHTSHVDNNGEKHHYQYRILEITSSYKKYQNFYGDQLGPVFEATRKNGHNK